MRKITLFGLAGTGTSTVGRALAKKLGMQFVSSGDFSRSIAKELGLSINQFDEICRQDPTYDKKIDQRMIEFGQHQDNFLAEGRMTWYFIPDAFKIKLECNFDERIRRIATREQVAIEKAKDETMVREQVVADRFKKAYGQASISENSNFDLIIASGAISAEAVVDKIISRL